MEIDHRMTTQDNAVFGVVREGIELVKATAQVPTSNDPLNRPIYEVHINSITLQGFVNSIMSESESEKTSVLISVFQSYQ